MLGDGRLFRTGDSTAAYSEYHSTSQQAYLEWKKEEWGAFVTRGRATTNPKGYSGSYFTTHATRLLHPFWELFYPNGSGNKVFSSLRANQVDPLALAVWFMDDGSSTTNGYVRFSVGPDEASQTSQLKILRRYGLNPALYSSKSGFEILIDDRTSYTKFLDLVSSHVHPSLAYKLHTKVVRKAGAAPRDIVTKVKVQELLDRGLTLEDMSKVLGVPRTTMGRLYRELGFPPKPTGRPKASSKLEYPVAVASEMIRNLDPTDSKYSDAVVEILMRTGFPVPPLTHEEAIHDFDVLVRSPTRVEGESIVSLSQGGSALCRDVFSYISDASYHKHISPREAWYSESLVRRAVRFQIKVGDPVTPARVLRALRLNVRAPTNFRPCSAKALVDHFCPQGGLVLDPCAGYGGRAVGTLAAGRQYVGVDPHPKAGDAYKNLSSLLGKEITFYNAPFEDVDLGELQADLVLTSPPYFSVERYSDDPQQSWVRYKTWDSWAEGFLIPFIDKVYRHLKPGCIAAINTKNVKLGRRECPIGDILVGLAQKRDFTLEKIMKLPLGRIGKHEKTEPIFVFRKPVASGDR